MFILRVLQERTINTVRIMSLDLFDKVSPRNRKCTDTLCPHDILPLSFFFFAFYFPAIVNLTMPPGFITCPLTVLLLVVGSAVVVVVVVVGVVVEVELLTLLVTGAEAAVPVPTVPVPVPVSYSTESGDEGRVGFRLSARPTGPRRAASAMSGQLSSSG